MKKTNDVIKGLIGFIVITLIMCASMVYLIPVLQGIGDTNDAKDNKKVQELFSDRFKETDEMAQVDGIYPNYENSDKEWFVAHSSFFRPLYKVNSRFIGYDNDTDCVYKMRKSDIEDILNSNSENVEFGYSFNKLIQNVHKIGSSLTDKVRPTVFYWQFNNGASDKPWHTLSAFEDAISPDEYYFNSDEFYEYNILQETGLKIKEKNVVINKVIFIGNVYTFIFNADFTTKKKPAKYNNVKWLPDEGKSANVTFALTVYPYDNQIDVTDIDVVSYKMLN